MVTVPTSGLIPSGYIMPSAPFVNPQTGVITPVWWRFLISLMARTGGPAGADIVDVELLAAFAGITEQSVPDLTALLELTRQDGSEFAQNLGIELALSLAAVNAEAPRSDVFPAIMPEIVVNDDATLTALLLADDVAAAPLDGWTWSVENATAVAAGTYTLAGWAPFSGAITGMKAVVGPAAVGSLTETVKINGTAVTGINAVVVNSATAQSFTATATSSFIAGDHIAITITIGGGVPVGAWSTILYTRALS